MPRRSILAALLSMTWLLATACPQEKTETKPEPTPMPAAKQPVKPAAKISPDSPAAKSPQLDQSDRPVDHGPPVKEPPLPDGDPFPMDQPVTPKLAAEKWATVDLGIAGVQAKFPAQPKSKVQSTDTPQGPVKNSMFLALIPTQAAAFSVGITEVPQSAQGQLAPKEEFEKTIEKMTSKMPGSTIMSRREEEYLGRPGMRFSFLGKGPAGPTFFRLRLFRDGNRTYQLMAAHPPKSDSPADAEYFLRGLILPKKDLKSK